MTVPGILQPTNDARVSAEIAGVLQVEALRRNNGVHHLPALPADLHGPGDDVPTTGSQVLLAAGSARAA